MVIIGAKGFAKEVLEVLHQLQEHRHNIYFYDDVTPDAPELLYDYYRVLRSVEEINALNMDDKRFVLGIGGATTRERIFNKFISLGFEPHTVISPYAHIGHYETNIGIGSTIMTGVILTNDITIGKGVLINLNATIGHDTVIGDFCDIMPASNISGGVTIGNNCSIGTSSVILPKVILGNNVTVGAGAVVNKNVPDNTTVVGIPAKPLNL